MILTMPTVASLVADARLNQASGHDAPNALEGGSAVSRFQEVDEVE